MSGFVSHQPSSHNTFQHPLVRDLSWVLAPEFDLLGELPPHMRFCPPQSPEVLQDWLASLEESPTPLENFLTDHLHRRLGHYFERLVLFYLQKSPAFPATLVAHSHPFYEQDHSGHRVTLGELDFLLQSGDTALHLETAVKFYLGVDHAGTVHWIGPGLQDRLVRKLEHLRDHQLPLSNLLVRAPEQRLEKYFWVKGVLFHPWDQVLPLPPYLLPPPEASFWATQAQAQQIIGSGNGWVVLEKNRWLGGAPSAESLNLLELNRRLVSRRVLMLFHSASGRRLVVVPDTWPSEAYAAVASSTFGDSSVAQ